MAADDGGGVASQRLAGPVVLLAERSPGSAYCSSEIERAVAQITMGNDRVILIAGPTASGKSELALALAERCGGSIINADSMQVYRELAILTARPTPADEARAPHRLYGIQPAAEAYSVGRFVVDAEAAIAAVKAEGRVPILVGGTGLYFKALLEGLAPIPTIPDAVRRHWRAAAEAQPAAELHAVLSARDPQTAAALKPGDGQRIVRALEVLEATGRPLAVWQRHAAVPVIDPAQARRIVVTAERAVLGERAKARLARMMANGALAEVAALAGLGLSAELPAMRALGVGHIITHLAGTMTLAAAIDAIASDTRRYIKRQQTWLNRNMIAWNHINSQETRNYVDENFP
jgi:tRNA dimethylallyltransferase